jgi:pyruvate carboxylase
MRYRDNESEALRLSRLMAEISAMGYNPHVQLSEYRGTEDKRIGNFEPVLPELEPALGKSKYPRGDRQALLDMVRDSKVIHFSDTTPRDITQSNSGNRFRLAEDRLIGPYLDQCGFFSIENGGGAHFHVALMANMTYPFNEARVWNQFAPLTPKQILVRSTNLLGYKPQPKNLMRLTSESICTHHDIVRCFDFLNHVENMRPLAEVVMDSKKNIFLPAVALSWAKGFDIPHYMGVVEEIVRLVADVAGVSPSKAESLFILGLKDMAGVCPPRFISGLVREIRKQYPNLIVYYHRHFTDGLFVPAVGEAAKAGAHIVDTAIGAGVRWYGQGEVLSTAAYMEEELGLKTSLDKEMIRTCNFVLKQIMPYYDRYTAPYFRGIDHDVISHGMPGGAASSSQEGALKQGHIRLLPHMLKFLAGTRQIVRYHDVTPGSQITWNTAFLAVTSAFRRGGEEEVRHLLWILDAVISTPEANLNDEIKKDRLILYSNSNDAFKNLLLGKFGRLPLGFPPDWVYASAFGKDYKKAIAGRTMASPLEGLLPVDIETEKKELEKQIGRIPTKEEIVMYLNHPGDTIKTILFRNEFGNPNNVPLDVWFEGLVPGREIQFRDTDGKPHSMKILGLEPADERGLSVVRYTLNGEVFTHTVKVADAAGHGPDALRMADPNNPYHAGAPSNGDLWIMYVKPGDIVKAGEELFNITIMKQEKSVVSAVDGIVERVIKTADYKFDKKMVPVKSGELLVELGPLPLKCSGCLTPFANMDFKYCPHCGKKV